LHGAFVRVEVFDWEKHGGALKCATNGEPWNGCGSYAAVEKIWGWCADAEVEGEGAGASNRLMVDAEQKRLLGGGGSSSSSWAVVDKRTQMVIGVICLTNDDARNLTVEVGNVVTHVSYSSSVQLLEAMFLLMDRLFALGVRRIGAECDELDFERKKLLGGNGGLGFEFEGIARKAGIRLGSNFDAVKFSFVNSDWEEGGRNRLYLKLWGAKAVSVEERWRREEKEEEGKKLVREESLKIKKKN